MNPVEIRKRIDLNNKLIHDALHPNTFVLNDTVFKLLQDNHKLQEECKHEFESDGYCIYCDFYDAAHDEEETE